MKIYFQLFLISTFTLRSYGLATVSPIGEAALQVVYTRCCPGSSCPSRTRILACQIASTRLFHFPPMSGSSATSLPPLSLWLGLPFARCLPETSDFSMNLGRVWDSNPRCPTLLCNRPWLLIPSPSTTRPTRLTRFTFSLNFILTTSCRHIIHRRCSSLSDIVDTPTASFSSFRRGVSAWLASSEGCRRI